MNYKALVIYHIKDQKKEKKFIELCKRLQLYTRKIKPHDVNSSVGTLAGFPGMTAKKEKKAPAGYELPELLVFSGMSDKKLDEFLAEYRREGIDTINLKAIVTAENISWSLYELTGELVKERTSILMGQY